jgi:hypothetical protein
MPGPPGGKPTQPSPPRTPRPPPRMPRFSDSPLKFSSRETHAPVAIEIGNRRLPNPKRSRRERCNQPDAQVPAGRRDLPRCDADWRRWSGRARNQRVNHLGPRGRFIFPGVLKHCYAHGGGRFKSAWVLKQHGPAEPDGNTKSNRRALRVVAAPGHVDCSLPTCKPRRPRKREWSKARNGFAFSFFRAFVDLRARCAGRLVQTPRPFDRILPQHVV